MSNGHYLRAQLPLTALGLCFLILLFTGCDSAPNPEFEQKIQEKQSESEGDAYAALGNAPRLDIYTWWKADQRQAMANLEAKNFNRIYQATLTQLDKEAIDKSLQELFIGCRAAFAKAVAFQERKIRVDKKNAESDGRAVFDELSKCRDGAVKAGETDNKQTSLQTAVLRRFSSAGMTLVGVSAIAYGNEKVGVATWRQGDELLDEDKSGFKLTLKAFRGY